MDDKQAIARLRRGDLSGLPPLVERYQVKAARAAYLITQDRAMAEDVVQSVFVKIARGMGQYDDHRPFQPYLMRSVVNAAVQAAQRRARTLSLDSEPSDGEPLADLLHDPAPDPEDMAQQAEFQGVVRSALRQLPPEQRAVVVLRYYLDMSEEEVAIETETPIGTVKWRLHAARKRLRALLGQGA